MYGNVLWHGAERYLIPGAGVTDYQILPCKTAGTVLNLHMFSDNTNKTITLHFVDVEIAFLTIKGNVDIIVKGPVKNLTLYYNNPGCKNSVTLHSDAVVEKIYCNMLAEASLHLDVVAASVDYVALKTRYHKIIGHQHQYSIGNQFSIRNFTGTLKVDGPLAMLDVMESHINLECPEGHCADQPTLICLLLEDKISYVKHVKDSPVLRSFSE